MSTVQQTNVPSIWTVWAPVPGAHESDVLIVAGRETVWIGPGDPATKLMEIEAPSYADAVGIWLRSKASPETPDNKETI